MNRFVVPILLAASYASAQAECPQRWWDLASDLETFFSHDGTCSDPARAAIRLAFHDCFPGTCDGSIIKAAECTNRPENAQMVEVCTVLGEKAEEYNVSAADIIQFSAALSLAACNGGPIISFWAGRPDSYTATDPNAMPNSQTDAQTMVSMFEARGFNSSELVALTGAHTIARKLDQTPMDRTVGKWDQRFYTDTSTNRAPGFIDSDKFLSQASETVEDWRYMGESYQNFMTSFVPAMEKMSMMGNDIGGMADCTSIISWFYGHVRGATRRKVLLKGRRVQSELRS